VGEKTQWIPACAGMTAMGEGWIATISPGNDRGWGSWD